MNWRTIPVAVLAGLAAACSSSPTSTDGEPSPTPAFTVRLVTPDSLQLTIDNRASSTAFTMDTCEMKRERLENGVWVEAPPSPNDPIVQCGQAGGEIFPAGAISTFRRPYVAVGSDGGPERVRTKGMVAVKGLVVSFAVNSVPFFSEPFPGGVKE